MSVTQFKIADPLVVSITVIAAMGALAATDPYPTGLAGYDVSYPQCGGTAATRPLAHRGLNRGRPPPTTHRPAAPAPPAAPPPLPPALTPPRSRSRPLTNITPPPPAPPRSLP